MKVLGLKMPVWLPEWKHIEYIFLGVVLVLLWGIAPKLFPLPEGNSEEIARSIGLMVMLSVISFLGVAGLCWGLLQRFLAVYRLPGIGSMVVHFNELLLWQRLGFYFASFALLLLAAVGCMVAIC